jgi:hypothetical protein
MGRDEFVTEFLERGLYGFYLGVVREGEVEAGDSIAELVRDPRGFRVTEIARLYARDRDDIKGMQRAANLNVLPESWRSYFRKKAYGRRLGPNARRCGSPVSRPVPANRTVARHSRENAVATAVPRSRLSRRETSMVRRGRRFESVRGLQ